MSIIEKFALIVLPICLGFIIWMICDTIYEDLMWWIKLPITIGILTLLISLISVFAKWMTESDWY